MSLLTQFETPHIYEKNRNTFKLDTSRHSNDFLTDD